ncbi:DUF4405 domain-containing protein [bacterium]|nr:DUF4405 domain-containing protein [bacterium]
MKHLWQWVEERTSLGAGIRRLLFESIPGGPKWRHCWGKALLYTFFLQVVTGIILWSGYSPSSQTAWESVYFIQTQMPLGWFLRGMHHYVAQAFVVMLVLHLGQMILFKAYRSPREINFWILLALVPIGIAISATGWLLPFDQKGYWASRVSLNIASSAPIIGSVLKRLALGGPDIGHHTLTRFFALHAGVFPLIIGTMLLLHFTLQRRNKLPPGGPSKSAIPYWPRQFIRDASICLGLLGVVVFLIFLPAFDGSHSPPGIGLGSPADPSDQYSAARPEWFMLFLFQFLKLGILKQTFGSHGEFVGAFVIPGILMALFFVMPFIARRKNGQVFNLTMVGLLASAMVTLIALALHDDANNAAYHEAVADARQKADRIRVLAESPSGIPATGALTLLRNDPLTQGPALFAQHCAGCHRYNGHDGTGHQPDNQQSASDLAGFASRRWLAGLLNPDTVASTNYFGGTAHADGKMVKTVKRDIADYDATEKQQLQNAIIALSAEAQLKSQSALDAHDQDAIKAGQTAIADLSCIDCHQYRGMNSDSSAPDLTGYGSSDWLAGIIRDVTHARYYGKKNDRMPAFGTKGILTDHEIDLLTSWLRGEWYEPRENLAAAHP